MPNTSIDTKEVILLISLLILISLALYKTNKKAYILIGTVLLLPIVTNAICKASIEINSSIKISRPVPVTETIYWALQDNDSNSTNETLVLANHEIDGVLKGNFAGDTVFTSSMEVPWIEAYYENGGEVLTNKFSKNVTNVKIEGIVAPRSTAYWFSGVGYNASTFEANLSYLITNNITNMSSMFSSTGFNATNWSIGDLSNWNTSNVTKMSSMFSEAGYRATIFNLDLSNWEYVKCNKHVFYVCLCRNKCKNLEYRRHK